MFMATTALIMGMVGDHDIVTIGDGISVGTVGDITIGALTNTTHGTARIVIMDTTTLDTITTAIITGIVTMDIIIIEGAQSLTLTDKEVQGLEIQGFETQALVAEVF